MADITSITFAFYGFLKEQEAILNSYFDYSDKWDPPWILTPNIEDAHIIIVDLSSDEEYEKIECLTRRLPNAEVIVFSLEKPTQAKWHLERQPSGKTPIVAFSKLVLKISYALRRKKPEKFETKTETTNSKIVTQPTLKEITVSSNQEQEDLAEEMTDMSSFFNTLDSLLESKPNEKRKRFNEK